MIGLWVESSWVRELSVVVFIVEGSLGSSGDTDEVVDMKLVGEVLIEVVLEMLE